MALPNHRLRVFATIDALEDFIRNDVDITSIVSITTDDNSRFILLYDIT
jgi:hypothetical protein